MSAAQHGHSRQSSRAMAARDPLTVESWAELASQWQQAMQSWSEWWAGGFAQSQAQVSDACARATGAPFDPGAVAAVNAAYEPRFAQLWAAAGQAMANLGAPFPQLVLDRPADRRFASAAWDEQPYFAWLKQAYLLYGEYLSALASHATLPPPEKRRFEFLTRQFVDAISPTNFPATNPDVLKRAFETEGASLVQGMRNLAADVARGRISMSDDSAFVVGRDLALTPGSVVFRNALIELIQYDATTARVAKRPLLIVPPCINKYYILDLTPANSFVRHAVAEGHTVFMLSWRNIPPELGHLTWDDYLSEGVLAALSAAQSIAGTRQVNALGFCVGGTLLACALGVLAARGDDAISSVTFLTTMLDFADPGEIGVYISPEMLAARDPALQSGQRVHGSELANAFASLRPNDLVWNYVVNNYLEGRKPAAFDLLHWNGDSADLPGPMYAYYLKEMYVENRLRQSGALTMLGQAIDLSRIKAPAYVFAAREDHIVPWRSAYRTMELVGGEARFVLGASGHIAGVINPPSPGKRSYWTNDIRGVDAQAWTAGAASHAGSWWPHWYAWLQQHAGGSRAAPKSPGSAGHPRLGPAPGDYVLQTSGR